MALSCWRRMKSDKVYEVLRVKGRSREAMEVAFERKDRARLAQLVEEADEEVAEIGREMLRELVEGRH